MERRQAAAWGRIGGLTAWSRNDAATMTGAAHKGFRAKFEREVLAAAAERGEEISRADIEARAERARRAYMLTLAAKSAASRRKGKPALKATAPAFEVPGAVLREGASDARRPA